MSGFTELPDLQRARRQWIEEALESVPVACAHRWSEAIAVGSLAFVETVKSNLGDVLPADGTYALREANEPYLRTFTADNEVLSAKNTFFWDESVENAAT